jgi:2-polyprenyl-3-methyl-5-hydroxy-6-metoxy-1,4-benzoquinol methylase
MQQNFKISFLAVLTTAYLFFTACTPKDQNKHHNHQHNNSEEGHAHPGHDANKHMNSSSFAELVDRFENPERTEWQKPEQVVDFLGDLKGKKVYDLGAGTGYFSFRFVEKGAMVIGADVDERFIQFMQNKRDSLKIPEEKFQLRKIPYDNPDLKDGEVAIVFICDVYHHIENRKAYFEKVLKGLQPSGKLVVVDFKKTESPVGPPMEMKMEATEIEKELRMAGFAKISTNNDLLPYQYILVAQK